MIAIAKDLASAVQAAAACYVTVSRHDGYTQVSFKYRTDSEARLAAAELCAEMTVSEFDGHRWLRAERHVDDLLLVSISGPHHAIEQPAVQQ